MNRTVVLGLLVSLWGLNALADSGGGTLAKVKERGAIRLGYLEAAAPFSRAGENGPAGYSIDLCKRVAEDLRKQLGKPDLREEWVKVTLQDRLEAVMEGRIDLECGTTTWTLARQESVDFSLMTFVDGGSMLVRSDKGPTRIAEFAGKRIAVVGNTTTVDALSTTLKKRRVDAKIVDVPDEGRGMALLAEGKVDAYASDRLVLMGLALNAKGSQAYRLIDEDFSLEPYALVLPRDDHEFRLAVNRSLAQLFRSGEILSMYDTWFGQLGRPGVLLSAVYILQAVPE